MALSALIVACHLSATAQEFPEHQSLLLPSQNATVTLVEKVDKAIPLIIANTQTHTSDTLWLQHTNERVKLLRGGDESSFVVLMIGGRDDYGTLTKYDISTGNVLKSIDIEGPGTVDAEWTDEGYIVTRYIPVALFDHDFGQTWTERYTYNLKLRRRFDFNRDILRKYMTGVWQVPEE